jgi:hypothetical protein
MSKRVLVSAAAIVSFAMTVTAVMLLTGSDPESPAATIASTQVVGIDGDSQVALNGAQIGGPELEARTYTYPKAVVKNFDELENRGYVCYGITDPPPANIEDTVYWSAGAKRPADRLRPTLDSLGAETYDCLLTCLPEKSTSWSSAELVWATPCINTQLGQVSRFVEPETFFPAMTALMRDYPDLADTCHDGSHDAAKNSILVFKRDFATMLRLAPGADIACVGGFMHGVLDALGFVEIKPEDIVGIGEACNEAHPKEVTECAHAMGHAAWDVYQDTEKAVFVGCKAFLIKDFLDCTNGLVMRRFQRLGYKGDLEEIDAVIKDGVELCTNRWPTGKIDDGTDFRIGCWSGVAYQMWYGFAYARKLTELTEPDVKAFIEKVTSTCNKFPKVSAPEYPEYGGSVNYCDVETGRYLAEASILDQTRGEQLCSYSKGDIAMCKRELSEYIERTMSFRNWVENDEQSGAAPPPLG